MVHLVLDGRHMGTETERRQRPSGQAIFKPFRWSRRGGTWAQGLELRAHHSWRGTLKTVLKLSH